MPSSTVEAAKNPFVSPSLISYASAPMSFTRFARFLLPVSAVLMLASLVLLFNPGPQLSIEFTGGTQMEVGLPAAKTQADLTAALDSYKKGTPDAVSPAITKTKTETYFVRMRNLSNEEHTALLAHLRGTLGEVRELQYTTIGPSVGANLKQRAFWAVLAAIVAIISYIAFAFRKIPKSLSPWAFGGAAIFALVHDIVIMLGIFTILSYTTTFQVDTLFISALLSIMGYSVSDTIVIFDRIRDNLTEDKRGDFEQITNRSLTQTLTRTLNTGLGALIMLFALFFFGSESIRWFILALIIGTVVGTYSSFFVAAPLVVFWRKRADKKN